MAAAGVTLIDLSFASTVVLIQIVALDLVLGGDNAVVVALASRRLPENLVGRAALLGAAGAVLCRFLLATVATSLLQTPFVKIAGGGLLIAVALSLLSPRRSSHRRQKAESALAGPSGLWRAVGLILVADVAMSLDNVVAVAALANGDVALLALGLALSVPAIVFGGVLLGQVARRSPSLTLGAAVLIDGSAAR